VVFLVACLADGGDLAGTTQNNLDYFVRFMKTDVAHAP
jgi:hypothetical protein